MEVNGFQNEKVREDCQAVKNREIKMAERIEENREEQENILDVV